MNSTTTRRGFLATTGTALGATAIATVGTTVGAASAKQPQAMTTTAAVLAIPSAIVNNVVSAHAALKIASRHMEAILDLSEDAPCFEGDVDYDSWQFVSNTIDLLRLDLERIAGDYLAIPAQPESRRLLDMLERHKNGKDIDYVFPTPEQEERYSDWRAKRTAPHAESVAMLIEVAGTHLWRISAYYTQLSGTNQFANELDRLAHTAWQIFEHSIDGNLNCTGGMSSSDRDRILRKYELAANVPQSQRSTRTVRCRLSEEVGRQTTLAVYTAIKSLRLAAELAGPLGHWCSYRLSVNATLYADLLGCKSLDVPLYEVEEHFIGERKPVLDRIASLPDVEERVFVALAFAREQFKLLSNDESELGDFACGADFVFDAHAGFWRCQWEDCEHDYEGRLQQIKEFAQGDVAQGIVSRQ